MIKSEAAKLLFDHFIAELQKIGPVEIHPHKTMVSVSRGRQAVAYITQAGKRFIHVVFAFNSAMTITCAFNVYRRWTAGM